MTGGQWINTGNMSEGQKRAIAAAKGPAKQKLRETYAKQRAEANKQKQGGGPGRDRGGRPQNAGRRNGPKGGRNGGQTFRNDNQGSGGNFRAIGMGTPGFMTRVVGGVPHSAAFDGFSNAHLPCDEQTAPYRVTNLRNVVEISSEANKDKVMVVCPRVLGELEFLTNSGYRIAANSGPLCDAIAYVYDCSQKIHNTTGYLDEVRSAFAGLVASDPNEPISLTLRARCHNMSTHVKCLGCDNGLVPAGQVWMGAVPMLEGGNTAEAPLAGGVGSGTGVGTDLNNAETILKRWCELNRDSGYLKSFTAGELFSGPGHKIHSVVAENVAYRKWNDVVVPTNTTPAAYMHFHAGLEPIVIFIPRCGNALNTMRYQITIGMQWATRHTDIMLRAGQIDHRPPAAAAWNAAIQAVMKNRQASGTKNL
jgi:hypothetical protein